MYGQVWKKMELIRIFKNTILELENHQIVSSKIYLDKLENISEDITWLQSSGYFLKV